MSGGSSPDRTVAVGLTLLIALQPIVGVSGARSTTVVPSGGPQDTTVSVSAVADRGDTYDRAGVGTTGSAGSFASLPRDTETAAVASTVTPELGQAATPTSTPSPAPSTAPGTTGKPPDAEGHPVLVLSVLIVVVLLTLGVWFLPR